MTESQDQEPFLSFREAAGKGFREIICYVSDLRTKKEPME